MSILKLYKVAIASSNYIRNTSPQSHILRKMSFCSWIKEEEYRDHFQAGFYVCSECGNKLFSSICKFEHDTPWPAFTNPITPDSVSKVPEEGRQGALKVSCGKCGNGLGHEFLKGGPDGVASRF
ncbi:Methionine-R-sulfoxide reductase B1 [Armadillidium vulgare]|nr:Methionine-R-sulfoxide reductase B1 [Armadillidium vulgare]